jgi:type I restriction enzyme R subunit
MDTKEKRFESDIESYLLTKGGYIKGDQSTYDKKMALDMPVLISFIEKTQPKMWEKYKKVYEYKNDLDAFHLQWQELVLHPLQQLPWAFPRPGGQWQ